MSLLYKLRLNRFNRLSRKLFEAQQKTELESVPETEPGTDGSNIIAWKIQPYHRSGTSYEASLRHRAELQCPHPGDPEYVLRFQDQRVWRLPDQRISRGIGNAYRRPEHCGCGVDNPVPYNRPPGLAFQCAGEGEDYP